MQRRRPPRWTARSDRPSRWWRGPALAALVLAGLAPLAGACTTLGGGEEEVDPRTPTVQVDNDAVPSLTMTVWLASETGVRTLLGTVAPDRSEGFPAASLAVRGVYRLIAEPAAGLSTTSPAFRGGDGIRVVEWSLGANEVAVSR